MDYGDSALKPRGSGATAVKAGDSAEEIFFLRLHGKAIAGCISASWNGGKEFSISPGFSFTLY